MGDDDRSHHSSVVAAGGDAEMRRCGDAEMRTDAGEGAARRLP
jgi:hypothetical protein